MNLQLQSTVALTLLFVMIQEPVSVYSGKYIDDALSAQIRTSLFKHFKMENVVSMPGQSFVFPPSVNKRRAVPLFKRFKMENVPISSDVKKTKGVTESKRSTKGNHLASVTKRDESSSKSPNPNFTDINQHDKKISMQLNYSSQKRVHGNYSTKLPIITSREPLQQHDQRTLNTTNVEVTEKDLIIDNVTKSLREISSDSESSENANSGVSDEINKLYSEESSLLRNYKYLGGNEDEDSARWALEEVNRKFQTKPKGLKANSGSFNESNKHGKYNKNWEKPLLTIQANTETSSKSKESDTNRVLNEYLYSSYRTKIFGKNEKPATNSYLKKHMCSNCTNTFNDKQKLDPLEHSIEIQENATNASRAPVNNGVLAEPLFPHKKLRKTAFSNQTKMQTSRVPLNNEAVVQQLSVPKKPQKTEIYIQTNKMRNSNITPTKGRSNGNATQHYIVPAEKQSLISVLSLAFSIGKPNISNSHAPVANLGTNDRNLVQLGNQSSHIHKEIPQVSMSNKLHSEQKQEANNTENIIKQQNQTLKALNQMLKQSSEKVVLNVARVHDEPNHSNNQTESRLDTSLSSNKTKARPTKELSLKPVLQTYNASSQIHNAFNNKTAAVMTEKLTWNIKPKGDGGTTHEETVNSSAINQTEPIKHKFELKQLESQGIKKPSMNFKPRNLSLSNNIAPKYSAALPQTDQITTTLGPSNTKPADAIEIIDDSSDSTLATENTGKIYQQTSVSGVSSVPTSKNLYYGTRYPSNPASYTPAKANTKFWVTSSKVTPTKYHFGHVKQNVSTPYQPTNGQVEQPSVSQNVHETGYSGQTPTNGIPPKSESWWGNSPSINSGSVYSVLPRQPYYSTINPALYNNKYTNIAVGKRYGYRRSRRTFDLDDLSSESTEGQQAGSGSGYDVKPHSKGTIAIKLMPKTKDSEENDTSNAVISPVEQFSDHSNQNNREKLNTNQSNGIDITSTPTSTITLNLSNYQSIKDLQEDQEDNNKRKKQSDYLTTENGKNLELKVFHTSPTSNAKSKNGEDQTHQEISIQLGAQLSRGKNQEDSKKGNSGKVHSSKDSVESQSTDDDKAITDLQKKIEQQNSAKTKAKSNNENKTQQLKNTGLFSAKFADLQQRNNSFQEQQKTQGKPDNNKESEDISRVTTDQETTSIVQGDAVAHVVIHDLSGKPVFKGKVNFFLPNHTHTNSVKNVSDFREPKKYTFNASNDMGDSSFPKNVSANRAKDALFQEGNDKLRRGDTYEYQQKNKEHYSGSSSLKVKNTQHIAKTPSEENASMEFDTDPTVQRKEEYKGTLDGNEVKKKKEPEHNKIDSTEITDLNAGKYPQDEQNLTSDVNIPLIEKELNKEINMKDHLMITENTNGNDSFDSKKENGLMDKQLEFHHKDGHTKTIKGIKSVTISLQKGNESIPIMQQLAEPLQQRESDGQHPTFQVTTSSISDDIISSGVGDKINQAPSLSLTVTTDEPNSSNRIGEDKENKGNGHISVHPSTENWKSDDQRKEQYFLNSTENKNHKYNPDNYLIHMEKFQEQNHQIITNKAQNPKTNQQIKNNLVREDFKSRLSHYNHKFKFPEEQKISIVNEKQKLVIPLALAQEYKQADNDQTLAEQENLQNDLAVQAGALTGEKPGDQATNVVTVGDPRAHKWVNCRATPSTKGDGSLTILNCDKKDPSHSQELEAGVDPRLPAEQNYLQGLSEPAGIGYPIASLTAAVEQPQPKHAAAKNRAIAQDINQRILNSVNSELKAEGNLITKIVAESTRVKPDPQRGFNLGESSYFTDSASPVSMPQGDISTFWGAGIKPRPFSMATIQTPFVHQFQRPPHHTLGNSRHSLPLSNFRSPFTHQLVRPQQLAFRAAQNPLLSLNSLHMPLVHHFSRPLFHHTRGRLPLNREFFLRSGLRKRFRFRAPEDGPPGKRTHILRNRPRTSGSAGNYGSGVRPREGEWAYLGRVFCCCPCCM